MSTRQTITLAEAEGVVAHLYKEHHDGATHLELDSEDDRLYVSVNLIVPEPLVPGLAAILRKSEKR